MEIHIILEGLLDKNNNIRIDSEVHYNQLKENNNLELSNQLISILANDNYNINIRSLSGVLLRKQIGILTDSLNNSLLDSLRDNLLQIWFKETNKSILKSLNHILANSASIKEWNNLIPNILKFVHIQPKDSLVLSTLNFIEVLCEYYSINITNDINSIIGLFDQYMRSSNPFIQISCVKAILSVIVIIEDDKTRNQFKQALPLILNILNNTLVNNDETNGTIIMEYLISIAEIQPSFFKGSLDLVVDAMLFVAKAETLEISTRSIALELIVTITETSPSLARKCSKLLDGLVPIAFSLMLELDEDESDWKKGKYTEESVDDNYVIGEEAIERVCTSLGGKLVGPFIFKYVQTFIVMDDYKYRRAAIAGLTRFAEGSVDVFKNYLNETINLLNSLLNDPSDRVKYEVLQAIGRIASLFPDFIPNIIQTFIYKFILILQDINICDKLRGHAASAMINIFHPDNDCENYEINKYINELLNAIVITLQSSNIEVKIPTIVLLGCIAQCSKSSFVAFYPSLINGIKSILYSNVNTYNHLAIGHDVNTYQGKAIECVGLMTEAIGSENFYNNASEIMQFIIHVLTTNQDNDLIFDYYLPATARISKVYSTNFTNYLPTIMKLILKVANQKIDIIMTDADDDDIEGEITVDEDTGDESTVIKLGLGVKKRVTMNTHAVQQKLQATRLLVEFTNNLKSSMFNYLSDCFNALTLLVVDKHSVDIRISAVSAMAAVFKAYIESYEKSLCNRQDLQNLLDHQLNCYAVSYPKEVDIIVKNCYVESMNEILILSYKTGKESLDYKFINQIVLPDYTTVQKITNSLTNELSKSIMNYHENNQISDEYDNELPSKNNSEDDLEDHMRNIIDWHGNVLKCYPVDYINYIDTSVLQLFSNYLKPVNDNNYMRTMQILIICLIDDIIEYSDSNSIIYKYINNIIELFFYNITTNTYTILKQCSIYGLVQLLRKDFSIMIPFIPNIITIFVQLINSANSNDDENIGITENAVFGLGLLLSNEVYLNFLSIDNQQAISNIYLTKLPLLSDETISKLGNRLFCNLIDKYLNNGYSSYICDNLHNILRIITDIITSYSNKSINIPFETSLNYDIIHKELRNPIEELLKKIITIASSSNNEILQKVYSILSNEQQQIVNKI